VWQVPDHAPGSCGLVSKFDVIRIDERLGNPANAPALITEVPLPIVMKLSCMSSWNAEKSIKVTELRM